jgi:hypothetical protein
MPSKRTHRQVPPTRANCEADLRDKKKLNAEFNGFKKLLEQAAQSSSDVRKLRVPLRKLERSIRVAAHGKHFVVQDKKKHRS